MHRNTDHGVFVFFLSRGHDDVQVLPDIILELPDIHPLGTLRIVDPLWPNTPSGVLRQRQEILFARFHRSRDNVPAVAVEHIVEARSIVIVVVEELGVERNSAPILR